MSIRLVTCLFDNDEVTFFEMGDRLYTTNAVLARALGITPEAVLRTRQRYAHKFSHSLRLTASQAKEELVAWLSKHREQFLIERIREDMLLFEVRDAVKLAFYARSKKAAEFSDSVIELYVQNLQMSYIPRAEHEAVLDRLLAVETTLEQVKPILQAYASGAGRHLRDQKDTKKFRN
jgi:hypothetical protein